MTLVVPRRLILLMPVGLDRRIMENFRKRNFLKIRIMGHGRLFSGNPGNHC